MPVYTGKITRIGSGNRVGTNFGPNWMTREFIDIGNHHLRNITLTQYLDDFLGDAIKADGETKISVFKLLGFGTRIIAIKLPDGHVLKSDSIMMGLLIIFFYIPFFGLLLSLCIGFAVNLISESHATFVGSWFFCFYVVYKIVGYLRARRAP